MSRDEIIKLAREAGIEWQQHRGVTGAWNTSTCGGQSVEKMARFAALVAAAEREACAEICCNQIHRWVDDRARYAASECAIGIRARGEA